MFTGKEDHSITLADAAAMTKKYRAQMPTGAKLGGFFGKDAIQAILDQSDCVGIRYYYGLNANNEQVLILTGVNKSEDDLYQGELAEQSLSCPDRCSTPNPLNSSL